MAATTTVLLNAQSSNLQVYIGQRYRYAAWYLLDVELSISNMKVYAFRVIGARWLRGRMPDSQSRGPGFESPLLPFRSLGIFFHFTTHQSTQLYK